MNDKRLEELSALMDGEASAVEVRRLLKQMEHDPELAETWDRYHRARYVVQDDREVDLSVDLSSQIAAAIDQEATWETAELQQDSVAHGSESRQRQSGSRWQRWLAPVTQTAVAASVAVSVMIGYQWAQVSDHSDVPAGSSQQLVQQRGVVSPLGATARSGGGLAQVSAANYGEAARFSEPPMGESLRVSGHANYPRVTRGAAVQVNSAYANHAFNNQSPDIDRYIMTHAGNAALNTHQGMMPFARVVNRPAKRQ